MSLGSKFVVHLIWYGYTRTFFTHDFMEEHLYKAGFTRVDRCAYRETRSPYPGIVELNREEESLLSRRTNTRPCRGCSRWAHREAHWHRELHVALEEALSRRSGTQRRISGLKRRPSIYSTSFVIDELDARLDDGTSLRLLYKDLSRFSVLEAALEVKPAFLYDLCAR